MKMKKSMDGKRERKAEKKERNLRAAGLFMAFCLGISISAAGCGNQERSAKEAAAIETEADEKQTDASATEAGGTPADVSEENTVAEAAGESGDMADMTETSTEEETEEAADYSWIEPYREFLSDPNNLLDQLETQNEGGARGFISGFWLYDIDQNGVPELLIQKYHTSDYIYTCVDGEIQLRNIIPYDSFSEALIACDPRDGKMYYLTLDSGTGTDRGISLDEMYLPEEGEMTENSDYGRKGLYWATYGGIEQSDGSYLDVEWEDAVPAEESLISKDEFSDIVDHLEPMIPREIREENLTKYLQEDYLESDLYQPCSLEDYRKQMEEREAVFEENVPVLQEGESLEALMEDGRFCKIEDWQGALYCDMDTLACYREDEIRRVYQEEWKNIYLDWLMNIDRQTDEYGYPIISPEDLEYANFELINWGGTGAPILAVNPGIEGSYYYIEDGQVKQFYIPISSYGHQLFIAGTDYFLDSCLMNSSQYADVLQFHDGTVTQIGGYTIWRDLNTGNIENQFFHALGNDTSQEEFTVQIDSRLGTGAAAQVMNHVLGGENGGPMTYVEGVYFNYSEIEEALSDFQG